MSLFTQFTNTTTGGRYTLISSSRTFTIPQSGTYRLYVCGAGGSGGSLGPSWGLPAAALGGGAGGLAIKTAYFNAGTNLVMTIGAGGTGAVGFVANGTGGGATNVAGGGINVTANGGGAGGIVGGSTGTWNGGGGGTAGGGDFNFTGGAGGVVQINGGGGQAASGGGAVAWNGIGYAGGTAITSNVEIRG